MAYRTSRLHGSRRSSPALLFGAASTVVAVAVCGCASGSSSAAGTASSTGTTGTSSSIFAGTAANSSLAPLTVGFHNAQGGSYSWPDLTAGFEEGVKYVNAQLDGVNGHPLKAIVCTEDGTPEASVSCANEFVQDKVVMGVDGIDINDDAVTPILKRAGIADMGDFAFTPLADKSGQDTWEMLFSNEQLEIGDLIVAKDLGATKIAWVEGNDPAYYAAYKNIITPAAKKLGLTVKPFYYPPTVDWPSFAATVAAYDPNYVEAPVANDAQCLGMVPALRAAGYSNWIHPSSCTQISQLPYSDLQKVITLEDFYTPTDLNAPASVQHDLAIWSAYMHRDAPNWPSYVDTELGFMAAVQAADVLRQVKGPVTAASVLKTIPTATGSRFFETSGYNCATPAWPATSSCGSGLSYATWTSAKRLKVLYPSVNLSSYLGSSS
jgi:branched-chain amino acid transport system substrate-binding protein